MKNEQNHSNKGSDNSNKRSSHKTNGSRSHRRRDDSDDSSFSSRSIGRALGGYKSSISKNARSFFRDNSSGVFVTLSFLGGMALALMFKPSEWERETLGGPMKKTLNNVKDTITEKTGDIVAAAKDKVQSAVEHVVQ